MGLLQKVEQRCLKLHLAIVCSLSIFGCNWCGRQVWKDVHPASSLCWSACREALCSATTQHMTQPPWNDFLFVLMLSPCLLQHLAGVDSLKRVQCATLHCTSTLLPLRSIRTSKSSCNPGADRANSVDRKADERRLLWGNGVMCIPPRTSLGARSALPAALMAGCWEGAKSALPTPPPFLLMVGASATLAAAESPTTSFACSTYFELGFWPCSASK